MNLLEKVSQFIDDNQLIEEGDSVLIGLSGGSDSVTLLHVLSSLGYRCVAAHCNFHLRGDDSDMDEQFVTELCRRNNIEIHVKDFDTVQYAKDNHISIEMAARELRYAWFEELRCSLHIHKIAIAHHQDDSNETILLNLIRGTGIKGLTGIRPQNGSIIRPLLCLSKKEIDKYIDEQNLSFVTDKTNSETVYQRNKIRLEVLPLLETINPSVKKSIEKMAQHLAQVENIYRDFIEKEKCRIQIDNKISIVELKQSLEPEAVLFEILSAYGFNSEQVNQIYQSLDGISGKIFLSPTHRLVKDRAYLIVEEEQKIIDDFFLIDENIAVLENPISLKIEKITNLGNFRIPKSKNILCVDKNKVTFPLELRKWQKGDKFIPFGMKGWKKVSDYFSDNKFSIIDKDKTWILTSADKIMWIVGHRSDERFKVEENTTEILTISFNL